MQNEGASPKINNNTYGVFLFTYISRNINSSAMTERSMIIWALMDEQEEKITKVQKGIWVEISIFTISTVVVVSWIHVYINKNLSNCILQINNIYFTSNIFQ